MRDISKSVINGVCAHLQGTGWGKLVIIGVARGEKWEQTQSMVPGWENKPTNMPPSFLVSRVFFGSQDMLFKDHRLFLKKPTDKLSAYLSTSGTNSQVFLDPRYQCTPIIHKIVL